MPTNYLGPSGTKAFVKDTSRWYAARNNKLLSEVDKALEAYSSHSNAPAAQRVEYVNNLLKASQDWVNSKQDKVHSQHHSFRLPIVKVLQDQAESEKRVIMLQLLRENMLKNEQAQFQQKMQQKGLQQQQQWKQQKFDAFQNRMAPALRTLGQLHSTGVAASPIPGKQQPGMHLPSQLRATGLKVNTLSSPTMGSTNADNYWLEAADPKHRAGYHLKEHMPAFQQSGMNNLFEYADKLVGDDMKLLERDQVVYLEDLVVRTLFEVDYKDGKLVSKMNPDLQKKVIAKTKTEPDEKKAARRELFRDAGDASEVDTRGWASNGWNRYGDGWACFAMSSYGTTYIGVHQGGTFHHSSFLCGAPVLAAGMIKIENGVPVALAEKNGHYKCNHENMRQFVALMQERLPGVQWDKVDYYTQGGTPMTVGQMLNQFTDDVDLQSIADTIKQKPGAKVKKVGEAEDTQPWSDGTAYANKPIASPNTSEAVTG